MNATRLIHLTACACVALALAAPAFAQPVPKEARPKVGLVLGGGGARGGAHLGVLELLEELRVPFDCIAGTSIGGLVGGAYAAGVAPAEIKETIRKTDWNGMFDDGAGRDYVNLRRKQLDDRFYSGLEFGVTQGGLRYREGAVAGEKIKLFFNQVVRAELGERPIEDLPLPLTLIATDIGTGERVAMRNGSLTTAMRASMSVPGVIAPVVRDGRKLVDGGLVDNVPIEEARQRCGADVVIAVNVGSPLMKAEEVNGFLSVVEQMVNLLTEQNVAKSLALLKPTDIYLTPDLGDMSAADFTRQLDAAALGYKAADAARAQLSKLSVSPEEYREWRAAVRLPTGTTPPVIDEVQVAGTRFINADEIRDRIRQQPGAPIASSELERDLVLIYSQGDVQHIDYSVVRERDKTILRITPVEKPWGPDYLRFGLNLATDFRGESAYNIRALYRRSWLNAYGGEWVSALQLGTDQVLATEFYQPVEFRQIGFVRPYASFSTRKAGLYEDNRRLSEYNLEQGRAGFDIGANLGIYGQAKVGWVERREAAKLETGPALAPGETVRLGGVTANLALDTYDSAFFPSRGYQLEVDYFDAQHVSRELAKYARLEARAGLAYTIRDFTFLAALEGGQATKGVLPLEDAFSLGGPRRLSSYATGQILGDEYTFGRMEVQYRLTKPMPFLGFSLFAGITAEAGRMNKPQTELALNNWQNSFGAYLAANTPLGPFYFGYADGKNGKGRVYLFIGTP